MKSENQEPPVDGLYENLTRTRPGMDSINRTRALSEINEEGHKVFKLKTTIRVLAIVILFTVLMLLIIYGASLIANYERYFPVTFGGNDSSITLCEVADMSLPTSHLQMPVTEQLGDVSAYSIPDDIDSLGGGEHNGAGYLAYTFYLRNNTNGDVYVDEQINIVSTTKRADQALRIRIYRDGAYTTYAALASTGVPEYGTTPFPSKKVAVEESTLVEKGAIIRYTIVVWLEGDDPDCGNDISGGSIRLSTSFTTGRS